MHHGLVGKEFHEPNTEEAFLSVDYSKYKIQNIDLEPVLLTIIESRLIESQNCMKSGGYLSVVFLCGSILEGLLLGIALKKPSEFNRANSSPKNKEGKVKPFHEWSLSQFIDVSCEIGTLNQNVSKYGHALRDFRNYIHPYQQMSTGFTPDEHTALISMQVLRAAIACLCEKA